MDMEVEGHRYRVMEVMATVKEEEELEDMVDKREKSLVALSLAPL